MIKEFASFHNHSHFSVMDGISLPEEMIKSAKDCGLKSIAITDHGHCHAHADFYLQGKKHGVRTVFGVEAYIIHDLEEWNVLKAKVDAEKKAKGKDVVADDEDLDVKKLSGDARKALYRKGHLVILACNREGLANLYQIVFKAHKYGFYGKPRADKKILTQHAKGLVATSACMGGVISNKCWQLQRGEIEWREVVDEAREFDRIFGRGRFFLELQFNEHESQKYINDCMVKIHEETGIPLTVTTDSHYTKEDEWKAQELLYMLRANKTVATRGDDWDFKVKQLYIKNPEMMWLCYKKFNPEIPEAVVMEAFQNTLLIDSLVENFEPDVHQRLPTLPYANPFAEMGQRAIEGLKTLGLADRDEYKNQLLHELKVIKEKGISNYFLITQRMIQEAKKHMLVGPGRGSAAGGLVCYALGITDLDPIRHGLMFERFLDPNRAELPDIDVDFQDVDAVKDLLRNMFGEDNVACLSTYGTFQIKGLMKDLGRVYDIDHRVVNEVNKKIEAELKVLYINQDKSTIVIKLEDIQRVSPTFNEFIEDYPQVGEHMTKLYGRNRHIGRHASAVIIGDNLPAETALWVQKDRDTGQPIVQASFTEGIVNKNVSAMGFVKFDILGLAALRIIDHALRLIADRTGKTYEEMRDRIREHNLDLNDQKVLKHVFWDGNFAGIFQFSEKGIRRLAQRVKPDTFVDVSAITSIYRPGPLGGGFDKLYVENKHNPENVHYDHPLLESILKKTRGCIVFQEQLMQICNILGKMHLKDVNRVRKVLLKKDKSKSEEFLKKENDELWGKFEKGCAENGMESEPARELWEKLLKFGGYGFNKAHSDCYSLVSMQMAFLATYYPLEFYSAVLTKGQTQELQGYISDIRKAGIDVLPVDINLSKASHTVEGKSIRLSLASVLGVGGSAIEKIVANQPYEDFIDFLDRSGATKTSVIPLIRVGAMDSILRNGMHRKELESKYIYYSENPKLKGKKKRDEWLLYWNAPSQLPDYLPHETVAMEMELMGFTVRGSPFEILDREKKLEAMYGDSLPTYKDFIEGEEEVAMLPVLLKDFREKAQRNGQMMCFMKFETLTGEEFEAPAFSSVWRHLGSKAKKGSVYVVTFNRKLDRDPQGLLVGKPGFAQTQWSVQQAFVNVDEIPLS